MVAAFCSGGELCCGLKTRRSRRKFQRVEPRCLMQRVELKLPVSVIAAKGAHSHGRRSFKARSGRPLANQS